MKKKIKLETLIDDLPSELKRQVEDYVLFIHERYIHEIHKNKFKFEWEGFLNQVYENLSALELQENAYRLWEETDVHH